LAQKKDSKTNGRESVEEVRKDSLDRTRLISGGGRSAYPKRGEKRKEACEQKNGRTKEIKSLLKGTGTMGPVKAQ